MLRRAALALLLPAALLLPQSASAQQSFRVPEACEWTADWPAAEGLSEVSPYRNRFYFSVNDPMCGVTDPVMTDEDGIETPLHGGSGGFWMAGSFRLIWEAAPTPLKAGETYTITFSWVNNTPLDEERDTVPARPYTFTTAETDEEPPPADFDDLTIERFELIPGEDRVVFEATWPDPSPLHALEFSFSETRDDGPGQAFFFVAPAKDAPNLRYEFTDLQFRRRGRKCSLLRLYEDSILSGYPDIITKECTERGCSSVAAAPSIAWLAGLALVLFGRRRGGG